MSLKWLKKLLPNRETVEHSSQLGKLNRYLHQPALWRFDCHSISLGVAAGLFAAALPLMPLQMLIAAVLAILIRANLPIALAVSWVSNPITLIPITYFTYALGNWILGVKQSKLEIIIHKYGWHLRDTQDYWSSFTAWLAKYGKAFFVGLPIVAIGAALTGYLLVIALWHGSLFLHRHWKKKRRK